MKRRWNANSVVAAVLGGIVVLAGIDLGMKYFKPAPESADEAQADTGPKRYTPSFRVGDLAPDFTLPDGKGTKQTLSKLVNKPTLLNFVCGCSDCRHMHNYLHELMKKKGPEAPQVVSIASFGPEAEKAYRRDIPLKQILLFEPTGSKEPTVDSTYKGHPCPRVFLLNEDRTVRFISSVKSQGSLARVADQTTVALGFGPPGKQPPAGKLAAPPLPKEMTLAQMMPGADGAPAPAPVGAPPTGTMAPAGGASHGPGDGHGH